MRVVAGRLRGRLLTAPPGRTTRPITDRVKETLFNVLGHRFGQPGVLPAFAVLDVFCGPGSLGIEALSRGAASCTFVERDRRALAALRENVRQLGLQEVSTVLPENAWTMRPPGVAGAFGLIFVDPPYRAADDTLAMLDLLERLAPALAPDGLIVFRHERRTPLPDPGQFRTLRYIDQREVGRMELLLLTHLAPPDSAAPPEFAAPQA